MASAKASKQFAERRALTPMIAAYSRGATRSAAAQDKLPDSLSVPAASPLPSSVALPQWTCTAIRLASRGTFYCKTPPSGPCLGCAECAHADLRRVSSVALGPSPRSRSQHGTAWRLPRTPARERMLAAMGPLTGLWAAALLSEGLSAAARVLSLFRSLSQLRLNRILSERSIRSRRIVPSEPPGALERPCRQQ